jgi:NAD(P)-dependent dehydrogenase (short-subunit alcohol dehydrogenase family)
MAQSTGGARVERVAVVTGGARGIGFASARRLAQDGVRPVLFDVDGDAVEKAVAELGGDALARQVDVTDEHAVGNAIQWVLSTAGRIDVLVNNAGIDDDTPFLEIDRAKWRSVVDTNLTGCFLMAQLAARSMAAGDGGAIVHIASIDASGGDGPFAAYNASKAALLGLSRTMALELAEHGIRSNCVSPGFTHTDMTEKAVGPELMSYLNGQFARVPMKRLVRTDEVANAILFLSSEDASAITGIDLRVDCGLTSNWFILETLPEH